VEIREHALRVVDGTSLDEKLTRAPDGLTDDAPGPVLRREAPGRPPSLEIVPAAEARVPSATGMHDPAQRVRILHAFANHELQAAELFAWALLAFPDAPADFRRGLLAILADEQRHTRMYASRVEALGARFGDFPVSGYFWNKTPDLATPLHFVCAMSLTFENANLDHTVDYAALARDADDEATAKVIDKVHEDEVRHVHFGWRWLAEWKDPHQSMWDAYRAHLAWPLRPARARGERFHASGRVRAGLDPTFIALLEESER